MAVRESESLGQIKLVCVNQNKGILHTFRPSVAAVSPQLERTHFFDPVATSSQIRGNDLRLLDAASRQALRTAIARTQLLEALSSVKSTPSSPILKEELWYVVQSDSPRQEKALGADNDGQFEHSQLIIRHIVRRWIA